MRVDARRSWARPVPESAATWDWEREITAAIAMVARDPRYRVVLCGNALRAGVVARLDEAAAAAGVVIERQIRRGGGWDVEVRAG
jgi:hypothetical protein